MSDMMTRRQLVESERARLLSRLSERQMVVRDRIIEAVETSTIDGAEVFFARRGFSRRDLRRVLAAMGYERVATTRIAWQNTEDRVDVELARMGRTQYVGVRAIPKVLRNPSETSQ